MQTQISQQTEKFQLNLGYQPPNPLPPTTTQAFNELGRIFKSPGHSLLAQFMADQPLIG